MEDNLFIGQIFKQNCGDKLKVLEKSDKKNNDKKYLFKCEFLKYPYIIYATKQNILKGYINNPQIEQVEFIDKIWLQKCGDSLRIIEKSEKKQGTQYHWKCEFIKYPCEIFATKRHIQEGCVLNPEIENQTFINKIYPQYCGDNLEVLEKSNRYINTIPLYKCKFQKYPCIIYETKSHILRGNIKNPEIEKINFIGKEFPQNCGDILKVIEKTDKQDNGYNFLWKCQFIKYFNEVFVKKSSILKGEVINLKLPHLNKDSLTKYIQNNFEEKPTLQELADSLNISKTHLGQKIIEFNLKEYIFYYKNLQEDSLRNYITEFYKNCYKEFYICDNNKYYEIDIYIPELKLGFEYNGNYWHSELYKSLNYHQEKSLVAKKQDIQLIHIFEYEWQDLIKQNILKSLIKSKLSIFKKKIYARKCEIKEISVNIYQDFCNENHLQGSAGAKVKLGLFYQNELVQIMSFSLPRFTNDFDWEIIRECSKLNYCIIGGKEKLWKYFIKKYNPKNCISYCDFSKFTGNSYLKLGFKKERLNKPGFVWWDGKFNVFWRNPEKHKEMKEKYIRIFDAGQLVFIWNKL